jgi:hypothetical protein
MYILAAGGVLVAALIVWALTRTVEPASVMTTGTTPVADASTAAPTSTDQTSGFTTTASTTPTPTGTTPNVQVTNTSITPPPIPAAAQGNKAEVTRIAVEDLRAQNDRGEVTVIDVRDAASFATGHIPGAINMPFASIEGMADSIPKGKKIVTYCT